MTYEKHILTPPLRPLVKCPLPRPPARTCAFITTSGEPVCSTAKKNKTAYLGTTV